MSEEAYERIRQRMEERKRVTLTEGRDLIEQLEAANAEIARLQDQLKQEPVPSSGPGPGPQVKLPDSLQAVLDEATSSEGSHNPDTLAGAVYAWCQNWLQLRARLAHLLALEEQIKHDMQQLNAQGDALLQRFQH